MMIKTTGQAFIGFFSCLVLVTLQACASLDPNYEQPTVTLSSFRALPSAGVTPVFEIGLTIINPNSNAFQLEGVVYTVSIQGHDVVKGVGKDFPTIEAYSQQTVTLTAAANLFAGVRLIMDLMQSPNEDLDFEFEARLDTGGFGPSIRVKEKGSFRMSGNRRQQDLTQ